MKTIMLTRDQRYSLIDKYWGSDPELIFTPNPPPHYRFVKFIKETYHAEFNESPITSTYWGELIFENEKTYTWFLLQL